MYLTVLARIATQHAQAFTNFVDIAAEAVEWINIVAAFTLQEVLQTYRRSLKASVRDTTRQALYAYMWLALAHDIPTFIHAFAQLVGFEIDHRWYFSPSPVLHCQYYSTRQCSAMRTTLHNRTRRLESLHRGQEGRQCSQPWFGWYERHNTRFRKAYYQLETSSTPRSWRSKHNLQ